MKPTIHDALPFVRSIYARHSAGCCWHIVLDDGNDDSVPYCIEHHDPKHDDCAGLAKLAPQMSRTQFRKLAGMAGKR